MILPTQPLSQDRALLTVGALILRLLSEPKTVSAIWEDLSKATDTQRPPRTIRYDHFVLALDLLYLMSAVELVDGLLSRATP